MSEVAETVLVVDFGAQYAQLIARRVREARVYSEIVRHDITVDEVAARQPTGIILSGGPESVHADWAPLLDPGDLRAGAADPGHLLRGPADLRPVGGDGGPDGAGRVRPDGAQPDGDLAACSPTGPPTPTPTCG